MIRVKKHPTLKMLYELVHIINLQQILLTVYFIGLLFMDLVCGMGLQRVMCA